MRLFLLSDPDSPHTIKWASSLAEKGLDILLFGLNRFNPDDYKKYSNIKIVSLGLDSNIRYGNEISILKLKYFKALSLIKKKIKSFKPHIVHSHYATSYGLLGALSNFHPFLISVWGTDIQSFPYRSKLHKYLLRFNLNRADKILATSSYLANETKKFTSRKIEITPFGVDLNKFKRFKVERLFQEKDIIIGTIKSLEKIYGIEYLIKAFGILKNRLHNLPLKLLIVGGGSEENNLKRLVKDLKIEKETLLTGYINHDLIPAYHNMIDISVFLSNKESFGVSVIESLACERPVVVTNIGGLAEIVENGKNGFIVNPKNSEEAAMAIEKLIISSELRREFGINGRKKVNELYDWNKNLDLMVSLYESILNRR